MITKMKQWVLREKIPDKISKELNIEPENIRQFLFNKGIKTAGEAEDFLSPNYEKGLRDPFDMLDMEKAVKRILEAVKKNERIVIFGHYDADGVCASVVFHDFFKKIDFNNFHIHIPDRNEGNGLMFSAVDEFIKQKSKVIIALDCGITDVDGVEKANSAGIDVIIIDHHLVPEKKPNAYAIVDNKQNDDKYPFKFLCGAGTAFKVVCAVIKKSNEDKLFSIICGWEKWLLDAVAIATVADMVPLVDENRILVSCGLKVLKKKQRVGLARFYDKFEINLRNINEDDIAFTVAPRINVAGRIDHASLSFGLLTTQSASEADWAVERLETINNERKNITQKITGAVEEKIGHEKKAVIVEGDASWHPGVLGLSANKLMDKYNCPIFLWGKGESSEFKGSCRSDGSINLVEFMGKLPKGIFNDFGGHAMAGGFSLDGSRVDEFKNEVINLHKEFPKQKIEGGILFIDKELKIDDINWDFYSLVEKFQPFGMENSKFVFAFYNVEVARVKKFGNGGIHLQLDFERNPDITGSKIVSAIGFFIAEEEKFNLRLGQRIDLAASLEKNCFRGASELRLRIIDIKLK